MGFYFSGHKKTLISLVFCFTLSINSLSAQSENASCYQLCFTPQNNCTAQILKSIDHAQASIHMQAYSFTSKPILYALLAAKKRGVEVKVILDKSHLSHPEFGYRLAQANIPVWIDRPAGIAHNKVMIIDKKTVITGSFNFSHAAQYKNRENVVWISDQKIARQYLNNWTACKIQSVPLVSHRKPVPEEPSHGMHAFFQITIIAGLCAVMWMIFGSP
jgi:phosphatidylserine/phosphatidylglycerophosphate/cardiolipin synthase-like enzyme